MEKDTLTRVFFVTESEEAERELFETLEGAQAHVISVLDEEDNPKVKVMLVRNAYKEPENEDMWNYEDREDTFQEIANL